MQALTGERSSFVSPRLHRGWSVTSSGGSEMDIGLGFVMPSFVVLPACLTVAVLAGLAAIVWLLELRPLIARTMPFPPCGSPSDLAVARPLRSSADPQLRSGSELSLGTFQTEIHQAPSSTTQSSHEVATLTCALDVANAEISRLRTALQKAALTEKQSKILLSVVIEAGNKKKEELKEARLRIRGLEAELADYSWVPCEYSSRGDRCYVSPHRQLVRNRSPLRSAPRHTHEPRGRSRDTRPLLNKSRSERPLQQPLQPLQQPLQPSQHINRPMEPVTPKRRRTSVVKPRTDSGYFSMHEVKTPIRRLAFGPELTPESTPEKPPPSYTLKSPLPKLSAPSVTAAIDCKDRTNYPHFQRPLRRMGHI